MSEGLKLCASCGEEYSKDDLTEFDGEFYCSDCLEEQTRICSHCGERIWNDDNYGNAGFPLCERCYSNYYTTCERCHAIISLDDANYPHDDDTPYCDDCSDGFDDDIIHDYSYKPEPFFFGEGSRYFGVELEIDEGGELSSSAQSVLDSANRGHEHIYIKHDGSLNDGFEIVTHPMTLDYHICDMPWLDVVNAAIRMGYKSHQCGTCGLHIHVSRESFGTSVEAQEAAIARVLYFFEKHWEELLKFSRRTQSQLDHWAARYGYKEQPRDILDHAKQGCGAGRYTCVNLTNYATIEFRMFRGTLKYNTIIATLQLVDRICDVAVSFSDDEIKALSWTTFVSDLDSGKYPELITYLKERRLYTNEECVCEEEV